MKNWNSQNISLLSPLEGAEVGNCQHPALALNSVLPAASSCSSLHCQLFSSRHQLISSKESPLYPLPWSCLLGLLPSSSSPSRACYHPWGHLLHGQSQGSHCSSDYSHCGGCWGPSSHLCHRSSCLAGHEEPLQPSGDAAGLRRVTAGHRALRSGQPWEIVSSSPDPDGAAAYNGLMLQPGPLHRSDTAW